MDAVSLQFVDYRATPERDLTIVVPCTSPELGIHLVGTVPYTVSLWLQRHLRTMEALIEFTVPTVVRVLKHPDDERDVILSGARW